MKKSLHGMTSEEAQEKKYEGHEHEKRVAKSENGIVIPGQGKIDVITPEGRLSCKQGKKTQWGLYCLETMISGPWSDEQKRSISDYFNFLPDSVEEYLRNRDFFRNNPFAQTLFNQFNNKVMDLIKFFCGEGKIDIFHLTDRRDGKIYKISSEVFFNKISKSIKKVYTTKGGKLVIAGGEKNLILFELEMRKGTNHKKILFHSPLSRVIDIVKN